MKVTIEFDSAIDAERALRAESYEGVLDEFERYLTSQAGGHLTHEISDKFAELRNLYKV